ncbi:N-acetyldiaminopimelate deacetylase [Pullulanibacillus sp. KACC 23026]|uniref:N-acetyldiaminopimelate deacetylase n=1 Tax=Pullulanibacillus sp. KACC 23026 TaxID=3028315 RepID=UPI0023B04B2E|nr:N-acetyldiaminopimelate deacetylase [Pullulanibacillus sp. KACC 23026]WEG11772.1 N-acetyldiaminopimelate deacetylase [Pullulanibacillus sp. KACC 23026]
MGLDLISVRRQLHQIPELGFEEIKTQSYLLKVIETFPHQERIEIKTWKTGFFVKLKGTNPTRTLGYRTDIDGLPIIEETGLDFTSRHEGRMHACGHDLHMTIALGVIARLLEQPPLQQDLLFVFQPAEEGPGGALPMMQSDQFQEWRPDMMMALHIAPEYPTGTIATKPGLLFANTSELFIDLKGKGGHAAFPHLANDMVVAGAHLITQLQSIVSRRVNPLDSGVVTIGKITGGSRQNVIAESARLEGTIRALTPESMEMMKSEVERQAKGIEMAFDCEVTIDFGSNYYQVYNHQQEIEKFLSFARLHNIEVVEAKEAMTGEDFGYFLKEIPGFMFWLGVSSESGLHTSTLNPDEAAIPVAVDVIARYLTFLGHPHS